MNVKVKKFIQALVNGGSNYDSPPFIDYVSALYSGFHTLIGSGNESIRVKINRGVLQGDPLSPMLFNLVIDQLLRALPSEIGVAVNKDTKTNGQAFADDLILTAQTLPGAQLLLSTVEGLAPTWGLEFNPKKCNYIALVADGKNKKVKVVTELPLALHGVTIKGTDVDQT